MTTRERILRFIAAYREDFECGSSLREIGAAAGLRSISHVHYVLAQLRDDELIDWHELPDGNMMTRSVFVTADGLDALDAHEERA